MITGAPEALQRQHDVSRESWSKLRTYAELLLTWQKRINLIGPSTATDIWHRHIADALQLLPLLPPEGAIADLGSGAGIPGLVIAIATGRPVHLYESNGKKIAFLREASRITQASTTIHQVRIETLASNPHRPRVIAVTARAFAPLPKLLELSEPFLRDGAIGLFHKGQDVDLEIAAATSYWKMDYEKHHGPGESPGVILAVKEIARAGDGGHS